MRFFACVCLIALTSGAVSGQQPDAPPKFEIADVHVSPKGRTQLLRGLPSVHGARYEIRSATMSDLIRIAYRFAPDRIFEGPNWLEMDRYDVIAKMPAATPRDTQLLMLQSLLEDRFKLVVRKETRPLPSYALVAGKKPLMKEANGEGETGCKPKAATGPPSEGGMRVGINGTMIDLGPNGVIEFNCRNMSMDDFAAGLPRMFGAGLGNNPVPNETGLKGLWNFDVRWSLGMLIFGSSNTETITVAQAVEKQLGLRLEQRQIPTPVIVVESVDRVPSENPPGVAEALPPLEMPHEFEVADVKPSAPGGRGGPLRNLPGGRLSAQSVAMRQLLNRAFNVFNGEELVSIPDWANMARFDINAKAPAQPGQGTVDMETMGLMIRSLLVERFKLKWHTEERPVAAYTLVAVKPKMKKADPKVRSGCRDTNAPAGSPPGSESLVCQDVTMEQFADRLQGMAPGLSWPVTDSTELAGAWDFTLTFSRFPQMAMGPGRGGDAGAGAMPGGALLPAASEPSGGYTIFEAVEKQLGLKLEPRKRNEPVIVIDHLEQTPTEN